MNRDEYLAIDDVNAFASWFGDRLDANGVQHSYIDRRSGKRKKFATLCDALAQYRWDNADFTENSRKLDDLRGHLVAALDSHDNSRLACAAAAVASWGGVEGGNVQWLLNPKNPVRATITNARTLLTQDDDEQLKSVGRFNSSMTKIYSLLIPNFVIYDSRVAGAIAWFVVRWCLETEKGAVPEALRFACPPSRETRGARIPKLRNPSGGQFRFPAVNNSEVRYAKWNVRTSWLLKRALLTNRRLTCFHRKANSLRALEAALFMWGYDLSESCPWRNQHLARRKSLGNLGSKMTGRE